MMSPARDRLAAQAAAAGYPPALLTTVADATLPRHRAGQRLDDRQIDHLTAAVETLAQAGINAEQLPELVAQHRRRHGQQWRERLWAHVLRAANDRNAHPKRDAPSPGKTGPVRPAHQRPRPATPGRAH
jgi:hypothetical protein